MADMADMAFTCFCVGQAPSPDCTCYFNLLNFEFESLCSCNSHAEQDVLRAWFTKWVDLRGFEFVGINARELHMWSDR